VFRGSRFRRPRGVNARDGAQRRGPADGSSERSGLRLAALYGLLAQAGPEVTQMLATTQQEPLTGRMLGAAGRSVVQV
jgi:hypothetical protein